MARRIKTDKQNKGVEEALEHILETQLQQDNSVTEQQTDIVVDDLKRKIEEINTYDDLTPEDESLNDELSKKSSQNKEFIKQFKAANDDKGLPSFYQIFSTRSSSKIYLISTALSITWLICSSIIAYNIIQNSEQSWKSFLSSASAFTLISGSVLPVILIWVFAKLFKNSKDLSTMIKSLISTQLKSSDNSFKHSSSFNTMGQNISEEVQNIDSGIQRTFERACELETIVQGEVQNLERAYSENEDKIRKLISMLANERHAILEHADRVKSTLQLTSSEISNELSGVTNKITLNIETIADRLSESLNEKTQHMLDNLKGISGSLTGELIEDIDNKGTTYLEQLDTIFDRVKTSIESHSTDSISIFENKLSEIGSSANIIVNEFNNKFDDMDALLQHRSKESLQNFEGQLQNFTNIFNAIPDRLDVATKKALVECEKNLLALDDILSDQSKSAITSFITYSISIEEHTDKLTNLLDSRVTEINNSIKSHITDLSQTIDNGKQDLFHLVDATHENVNIKVNELEERIGVLFDNRTKSIEEKFNDSNNYISDVINNESSTMSVSIQQQINLLSQHLNNIETAFIDKLSEIDGHKDKQVEIIQQYNEGFNAQLEKGLSYISNNIDTYNQNLENKSQLLQGSLDNSLTDMLNKQAELIDARIEKMREIIINKDEKLGDVFNRHLETYEQKINESNNSFTSEFNNHLNLLEEYAQNLHEAINKTENLQENLSAQLDSSVQKSIESLKSSALDLGSELSSEIMQTASLLSQEAISAKQYVKDINTSLTDSIATFEQGFATAHENVIHGTQYVAENIKERIVDINESIKNEADSATQKMLQAGEYINSSLVQVTNEIEQRIHERSALLNDASVQIYEQIDDHLNKVGSSMNELKQYNDEHFLNQLDELNKTTSAVYNAAMATNEAINNSREEINDQIANTAQKVKEQFYVENKSLLEAVGQRSFEISESLQQFNSDITNNVVSITNQLANSSNSIFTKTSDIINSIQNTENNIALSVQDFTKNAENITRDLAESFKAHAELLSKAGNLLDKVENNFDNNINEKKRALNILTETLANKTDEITKSINYYEHLLDNNFNKMNNQAKSSLESFSRDIQHGLKDAIDRFNATSDILKAKAQSINYDLNNVSKNHNNFSSFIDKENETMKQAINDQAFALGDLANLLSNNQPTSHAPSPLSFTVNTNNNISLKSIAGDIIKSVNISALSNMWRHYRKNAVNIQPISLYTSQGLHLVDKIKEEYNRNFNFKKAIDNYITEFEEILQNINTKNDPNGVFNALQTNSGIVYTVLANITGRIS